MKVERGEESTQESEGAIFLREESRAKLYAKKIGVIVGAHE